MTEYTQKGQRVREEKLLEGWAVAPCLLVTDRTLHLRMPLGASAVQQAHEAWPGKPMQLQTQRQQLLSGFADMERGLGLKHENRRVQAYL